MKPNTDANLSRAWSRWLAAREVGDQHWRFAALNELIQAATAAHTEERPEGYPLEANSGIFGLT
jgi:hypothetical protein